MVAVLRHDRDEHGGGFAIFACKDIQASVCEVDKSNVVERGSVVVHSDSLFGCCFLQTATEK